MRIVFRWIKKIILPVGVAAIISAVFITAVIAQTTTGTGTTVTGGTTTAGTTTPTVPTGVSSCNDQNSCLMGILTNTYGALQDLNNYLVTVANMATSWLTQDNSNSTAMIQSGFSTLGGLIVQNINTQNTLQQQLAADLFGQNISAFSGSPPPVLTASPLINDLSYPTLLGNPPVPKGPFNPYNYLKYAAGFSLRHPNPPTTGVDADNILLYNSYYNTIMAAESFGAYALSNQYADYQNGNSFTTTQLSLITQASNSNWIAQISSEELGKVLRQLLMFESQGYVLLSQLIQLEKQMLTAQVINNSLLIAINSTNESIMYKRAKGQRLG